MCNDILSVLRSLTLNHLLTDGENNKSYVIIYFFHFVFFCSKTSQRNKQIAMGRKKFNMDPKKVPQSFPS